MRSHGATIAIAWMALAGPSVVGHAQTWDSIIVPGERVGPVTRATDAAQLVDMFGASLVRARPFATGEGFCVPGVVVLEGTPHELEIAWEDRAQTRIAQVRTRIVGGRWVTTEGVRIGTGLAELEGLNGRSFTFSGLGWDYGGGVASWEGGRLASSLSSGIVLVLDADSDALYGMDAEADVEQLLGDKLVRSDLPVAQAAGITVRDIAVVLGTLPDAEFCG